MKEKLPHMRVVQAIQDLTIKRFGARHLFTLGIVPSEEIGIAAIHGMVSHGLAVLVPSKEHKCSMYALTDKVMQELDLPDSDPETEDTVADNGRLAPSFTGLKEWEVRLLAMTLAHLEGEFGGRVFASPGIFGTRIVTSFGFTTPDVASDVLHRLEAKKLVNRDEGGTTNLWFDPALQQLVTPEVHQEMMKIAHVRSKQQLSYVRAWVRSWFVRTGSRVIHPEDPATVADAQAFAQRPFVNSRELALELEVFGVYTRITSKLPDGTFGVSPESEWLLDRRKLEGASPPSAAAQAHSREPKPALPLPRATEKPLNRKGVCAEPAAPAPTATEDLPTLSSESREVRLIHGILEITAGEPEITIHDLRRFLRSGNCTPLVIKTLEEAEEMIRRVSRAHRSLVEQRDSGVWKVDVRKFRSSFPASCDRKPEVVHTTIAPQTIPGPAKPSRVRSTAAPVPAHNPADKKEVGVPSPCPSPTSSEATPPPSQAALEQMAAAIETLRSEVARLSREVSELKARLSEEKKPASVDDPDVACSDDSAQTIPSPAHEDPAATTEVDVPAAEEIAEEETVVEEQEMSPGDPELAQETAGPQTIPGPAEAEDDRDSGARAEEVSVKLEPIRRRLNSTEAFAAIAAHFGCSEDAVRGRDNGERVSLARKMAVYILYHDFGMTQLHIGTWFSLRSQPQISLLIKAAREYFKYNSKLAEQMEELRKQLKEARV